MHEFTQEMAMRLIAKMRIFHGKKFSDQWAGIEVHEIAEAMVECLSGVSAEQLARGYDRLKTSTFCPSVSEFRAWCSPNADWLTPDEAWAQVQCAADDRNTVVWTDQAQQAWVACQPLIEIGDKFSAARCFKDAYKRAVEAASLRGIKPIYQVSLGYDQDQRITVVREAESKGMISQKEAVFQIGYIEQEKAAKPEFVQSKLAEIWAMLEQGNA